MVAGGLAGATPHMISATVTAISRLLFEFRGRMRYHSTYSLAHSVCRFHIVADAVGYLHYHARFCVLSES